MTPRETHSPPVNGVVGQPQPAAVSRDLTDDRVVAPAPVTTPGAPPGRLTVTTESALEPAAALASAVVVLAGVWLVLAPHALGYAGAGSGFDGFWNDVVVGIAVALIALARVIGRTPMLSAANVVLGIWLIVMPFVLSYGGGTLGSRATWNDVILGIIVIVFSLASLGLGSARRAR